MMFPVKVIVYNTRIVQRAKKIMDYPVRIRYYKTSCG